MKQTIILLTMALAVSLCACSRSGSPSGTQGGADAGATYIKEKPSWQLRDASTFIATIEPWPPQEGAATLKAEATAGAHGKFVGTVEYRLAAGAESSAAWVPVPKASEDADGIVSFATPVTLNKGKVYVHFRVSDREAKDGFSVLTDWHVTVK